MQGSCIVVVTTILEGEVGRLLTIVVIVEDDEGGLCGQRTIIGPFPYKLTIVATNLGTRCTWPGTARIVVGSIPCPALDNRPRVGGLEEGANLAIGHCTEVGSDEGVFLDFIESREVYGIADVEFVVRALDRQFEAIGSCGGRAQQ